MFSERTSGGHTPRAKSRLIAAFSLALGLCTAPFLHGQDTEPPAELEDLDSESVDELMDLDLEQLLSIDVTSVAGVEQSLLRTPAAMYVIDSEEIRRTGHKSLAEVFRLVPGMHVGKVSSNVWAVGSRGFADRFTNNLLVLVDGRVIYDPFFAGTYWDIQDVPMEDIDRIEVVRGPGATLWGSNAVNGVINVVSRSARDTQGWLATGGGGTEERGFGSLRYGGQLGEAYYRVWGMYFNRDGTLLRGREEGRDDWEMFKGGFRLDWDIDESLDLTFISNAYQSDRIGQLFDLADPNPPDFREFFYEDARVHGFNFIARLEKEIDATTGWSLQAYYDRSDRKEAPFRITRDTFDLDFRNHFKVGERNTIVWGVGAQLQQDSFDNSFNLRLDPIRRVDDKVSGFVQNTLEAIPDRLDVLIGAKLEHNDYTGFEIQPSVRATWTPTEDQTVWAAFSRAVRIPSRVETDGTVVIRAGGFPVAVSGNEDTEPSELLATEIGYRIRPTEQLYVDLAAYFNRHNEIITPFTPGAGPNDGTANVYGVELAASWDVLSNWRLAGSAAWTAIDEVGDTLDLESGYPRHTFNLQSFLDITEDIELNSALYYVDHIDVAPSYVRLDLGLTWRPAEWVELAVWGKNLTESKHREQFDTLILGDPATGQFQVERSVFGQITVRF